MGDHKQFVRNKSCKMIVQKKNTKLNCPTNVQFEHFWLLLISTLFFSFFLFSFSSDVLELYNGEDLFKLNSLFSHKAVVLLLLSV